MTISARDLRNTPILAEDGSIGHVEDIYFDDQTWRVRYLVVDTRNWLPGRKVLISPESVVPHVSEDGVRVRLTREQIKKSPDMSTDRPVSNRMQANLASYYAWSATPMGWMPAAGVPSVGPAPIVTAPPEPLGDDGDPHLRSVNEVIGYSLETSGEAVGHIYDLAISTERPEIESIVVEPDETTGRRILVHPRDVTEVDFDFRRVRANTVVHQPIG